MDNLYVLKEQIQQLYAKHAKAVDKGIQFILALLTFYMVNHNLGFMGLLSNPLITLGLSVICAFLPTIVTVLAAALLVVAHMTAVSLGIAAVTGIVFVLMFIFYIRFSPKTAVVVLLTALAFMLKIPYVIPVAFGLVGTPVCVVPIVCGTIAWFMIEYVEGALSSLKEAGSEGMINQITVYVKQTFQNKEMLVMILAFVIVLLLVYQVRRMSVNHAWKIAAASGAAAGIVIVAAGSVVLGVKLSYVELILGSVAAVAAGLILEFLFFAVDYSRSESVQYEDDEYYYYVKAVPKIAVAVPEKTVKRINGREVSQETEIIDAAQIRKKAEQADEEAEKKPRPRKRAPQTKGGKISGNTEHLLLTRSLRRDLHLDDEGVNE